MDFANFIVGVTALAVSLGGFAIAIWQIRKARSAAEAATEAATDARKALVQRLAIGDIGRVAADIERLKDFHRNQEWQRALDQYPRVRQTLVEIRTRVGLGESDIPFQRAIVQLATMESVVERALEEQGQAPVAFQFNRRLVQLQQVLDDLRSGLETAVVETME